MIVRAATAADIARFAPLIVPDPASPMTIGDYQVRTAHGEYRPEWTWIAEDSGAGPVLAAGIWWGRSGEPAPETLHGLFTHGSLSRDECPAVAGELIATAHQTFAAARGGTAPDFHLMLPGDWRGRRDVMTALSWRWEAALSAGLTDELERLRFEWTPAAGLPSQSGRLTFRAEPDDEVFAGLFRRVLAGSLDATSRKTADAVGAAIQARLDVAFYRDKMHGDRAWWRVAEAPDGEPAGFGVPSRNTDVPVVGYLGVLPECRGRGYVDDILAEITRVLVAEAGADTIHADTDLANQPMAAAFERAGYRNFARRLALSAPLPGCLRRERAAEQVGEGPRAAAGILAGVVAGEREPGHSAGPDQRRQQSGQFAESQPVLVRIIDGRELPVVEHIDVEVHPVPPAESGARVLCGLPDAERPQARRRNLDVDLEILRQRRAERRRLGAVSGTEQGQPFRRDHRGADLFAPRRRAEPGDDRDRHVGGLTGRRGLAVVEVDMPVDVSEPDRAEDVSRAGQRTGQQGAAAADQHGNLVVREEARRAAADDPRRRGH